MFCCPFRNRINRRITISKHPKKDRSRRKGASQSHLESNGPSHPVNSDFRSATARRLEYRYHSVTTRPIFRPTQDPAHAAKEEYPVTCMRRVAHSTESLDPWLLDPPRKPSFYHDKASLFFFSSSATPQFRSGCVLIWFYVLVWSRTRGAGRCRVRLWVGSCKRDDIAIIEEYWNENIWIVRGMQYSVRDRHPAG